MTAESGWVWMYGVAGEGLETVADGGTGVGGTGLGGTGLGVGGAPPRAITAAGLTAIVADVPDREFGEAALRRNLEDLDWLDQTARAHHTVLEAVAKRVPVVPMRLATLFASDAAVTGTLRERADDFRGALSAIAMRSEWGVKGFAVKPADPVDDSAQPTANPGTAYLRRRRAQLTADRDARQEAVTSAQSVYAQLRRLAASSRLYPPQPPSLTGQATPMVLNSAFLVADEKAREFTAAVTELGTAHPSVQLTITGPWPAYSFVGAADGPGSR